MRITLQGPVEFEREENGFTYMEEKQVTVTIKAETNEAIARAYTASPARLLADEFGGERAFTEVTFDNCRAVRAGHPVNDDDEEADWEIELGPISPKRTYAAALDYTETRSDETFQAIHKWGTSGRHAGRDTGARSLLMDLLLHFGGGRDTVYDTELPDEYRDLETGY